MILSSFASKSLSCKKRDLYTHKMGLKRDKKILSLFVMDPTHFVDKNHMPSQNMRNSLFLTSGNVTMITASKRSNLM